MNRRELFGGVELSPPALVAPGCSRSNWPGTILRSSRVALRSAEGEHVGAHAGVVERDLERPLAGGPGVADELVHARIVDGARAGLVDVEPVIAAGRTAVEERTESCGAVARRQDEVEVAALEAVGDRPGGGDEHGGLRV